MVALSPFHCPLSECGPFGVLWGTTQPQIIVIVDQGNSLVLRSRSLFAKIATDTYSWFGVALTSL